MFDGKVSKDIAAAREILCDKAKTYYSSEALNPRPKRGRPPKQVVKTELEPQVAVDMYTTVPPVCRLFLYLPEITSSASVTFSAKFDNEAQLLANLRGSSRAKVDTKLQALSERLESLRHLSSRLSEIEGIPGSEGEKRLIQTVGKMEMEEEVVPGKKDRIASVAKDFLPGKKRKTVTDTAKKSDVKVVTTIQHKKGRKK